MSLAELKTETAALAPAEQKELAAFLAALRMKQSGEWDEPVATGTTPDRQGWISLEGAKRQLLENS